MSLKNWFLIHIPPPEYMSMSHVGVDISPVSIHVIELLKKDGRLQLGQYGVHRLPTVVDRSQPLIQNTGLMEKLKEIQKTYHLDFVEVAIPEELAYLFTTLLPYGDEETIRNHIELHLEENVPIALADAVFDYHMIEEQATDISENATKTKIKAEITAPTSASSATPSPQPSKKDDFGVVETKELQTAVPANLFLASVSVVPKAIIDSYIEAFEAAGMTPVSFLIENQALSKSIIKKGDDAPRLIVHVGEKKSVLSVISNGSVQFTSTVLIGSEDFTLAIMKEYNVSREEAIRMKTERGFQKAGSADGTDGTPAMPDNQGSIFMSLINTASALKDEIERIVMYWQSYIDKRPSKKSGALASIVLSGRDALISGFKEYLSATVRLPVHIANVWSNVYDIDKKIPEIEYIDSLDYASAIGLALPKLDDID
jgi:Tfp pilus assembly PilM family ATPase